MHTELSLDHMISHKTDLNKFKKTEIILSIFSDHNRMILEISNKRKDGNFQYVANALLKNQLAEEEIKMEILKNLETNKNGNTTLKKNQWDAARAVLRGNFVTIMPTIEKNFDLKF